MTPLHFRFFASQFWSSEKLLIESFKACSSCIFLKMNMYAKYIYVYICLIYIIIEKKTSYEIGASRIYTQPAPNAENCYSGWTHSENIEHRSTSFTHLSISAHTHHHNHKISALLYVFVLKPWPFEKTETRRRTEDNFYSEGWLPEDVRSLWGRNHPGHRSRSQPGHGGRMRRFLCLLHLSRHRWSRLLRCPAGTWRWWKRYARSCLRANRDKQAWVPD